MKSEEVSALSAAVIAFVTAVVLPLVGFYYNLNSSGKALSEIVFFELLFVIAVLLCVLWIRRRIE